MTSLFVLPQLNDTPNYVFLFSVDWGGAMRLVV